MKDYLIAKVFRIAVIVLIIILSYYKSKELSGIVEVGRKKFLLTLKFFNEEISKRSEAERVKP